MSLQVGAQPFLTFRSAETRGAEVQARRGNV